MTLALFYLFAAILVLSALRVVTARNPVHAALFLVLSFFSAAMLWLLIKAEFLAISLVLIYVGAVMVLFLFVVMMLDINVEKLREGFWRHFPQAAFVALIMVAEMVLILSSPEAHLADVKPAAAAAAAGEISNVKVLGRQLYTTYLLAFEAAAVILLIAMVAAIGITIRQRKDSKYVDPGVQVRVQSKDRVRVVKMAATKRQDDAVSDSNEQQA